MSRHVKTGTGVSKTSYQNKEGQPHLSGVLQGKADVPALVCKQSLVLLKASSEIAPGLHVNSCTRERSIPHNNISYSDDNDSHVLAQYWHDDLIGHVVEGLRYSSTKWNNLLHITRGALALHKTCWRCLAWQLMWSKLHILQATEKAILMKDGKGAYATIKFKSPDQLNEGLRYRICPDGN